MTDGLARLVSLVKTARARWEFKLQDFWVGVFWRRHGGVLDVWICLLPCLPIHLTLGAPHAPRLRICEVCGSRPQTADEGCVWVSASQCLTYEIRSKYAESYACGPCRLRAGIEA